MNLIEKIRHSGRGIAKDVRGSILIEAAFVFPVLLLLLLGVFEVGSYSLLNLKLQNAAMNVADLSAREEVVEAAQLSDLVNSVETIVSPYSFNEDGGVILTGVGADADGNPMVVWQYKAPDGMIRTSNVGGIGAAATLNSNILVQPNDSIVVAEIFYDYQERYLGLVPGQTLEKEVYYRSRLGNFMTNPPL